MIQGIGISAFLTTVVLITAVSCYFCRREQMRAEDLNFKSFHSVLWFCWVLLVSAAHLFLDVLQLLLQLLHVSVDVGVVFVPLQGRDVSAGCLGATTQQHVENKTAIQATGPRGGTAELWLRQSVITSKARRLVKR